MELSNIFCKNYCFDNRTLRVKYKMKDIALCLCIVLSEKSFKLSINFDSVFNQKIGS